MSFVPIAIKCNGPLEAVHVSIDFDDDRYHTMWLNVALLAGSRPKLDHGLDLSEKLRRCRVAST